MNKFIRLVLFAIALLFTTQISQAFAVLINFETFADSAVVSGSGVFSDLVFSTDARNPADPAGSILVSPFTPGPDFGGSKSAIVSGYPKIFNYRATFSLSGVDGVSVVLGDFGEDSDDLFLSAYDSSNTLLNQDTYRLNLGVSGGHTLNVSGANISYVKFGSTAVPGDTTSTDNSIYFDNFSYNSNVIPEPASLSLLGLGLLGLILKRKKHSR